MSVEFRQRTPGEYAQILWNRKWFIVLPTVAVFFAVAIVVWRLPNVYQSTTLLTVRPATIPEGIVPQLSNDDLSIRINNIGQKVVSRSALEPRILTYDLYRAERDSGWPMDLLVERMREDISIAISTSRNDITNGFTISFRAARPDVAQRVASDLAGMYISEAISQSSKNTGATKELIDREAQEAKLQLDEIGQRRMQFLMEHADTLPTTGDTLLGQATNLHQQQTALITEIARHRDQRAIWSNQYGDIKRQLEQDIAEAAKNVTDPKTTSEWRDLATREVQLETALEQQRQYLKEKNPDVIVNNNLLAKIKKEKEALLADRDEKIAAEKKRLTERADNDPRIKNVEYNLKFSEQELGRQQQQLATTNAQIATLNERLNGMPSTDVGLQQIDREYQIVKQNYDMLLDKKRTVDLSDTVERNQQGESIQVLDPASLPSQPIAPKRPFLLLLGLTAGFGLGLLLAAAFEVPRLLTVQSAADARHYTSLPVLVTLPALLTSREERRRKARRLAFGLAGVIITVVSIPALAMLLRATQVLEMFAS
ncbi:MAG: GumC family protein [Pyrinomonadaceae bacterium]